MNLRTLSDMKKDNGQDDDKKKNTSSYTGGEKSGLAVQNPDVKQLMDRAQKNSKTPQQYAKEQKQKDGSVCKITLYQNGFIIDDGEFQDYNKDQNKQFMSQLKKGLIPKTLRNKYPNGKLSVSLSDHTQQKYTPPPPPPYIAFSGQGVSLSAPNKQTSKFQKKTKAQENYILEADKKKQITTIKVRLTNGQSITIEVNLDTSLQLVYQHVATVSGVSNFELAGGFPPKTLDLNSTIEKSDLAESTLIQKS